MVWLAQLVSPLAPSWGHFRSTRCRQNQAHQGEEAGGCRRKHSGNSHELAARYGRDLGALQAGSFDRGGRRNLQGGRE
eukprot:743196-Pyramimonas_sp.AAC.1